MQLGNLPPLNQNNDVEMGATDFDFSALDARMKKIEQQQMIIIIALIVIAFLILRKK